MTEREEEREGKGREGDRGEKWKFDDGEGSLGIGGN